MKRTHIQGLSILAASLLISACSSKILSKTEYREDHSRAWNIVSAGGMASGIADSKRPKNNSSTTLYDSAFLLSGFSSGLNGVGGMAGGAYNLIWNIVEPESQGARNTLIAWLPMDKAPTKEAARQVFLEEATEAIKLSLDELNIQYRTAYTDESVIQIIVDDYPEWGCKPSYVCEFFARIYEPEISYTPSYVNSTGETNWYFSGNSSRMFNFLYLGHPKNNTVDQIKLNGLISKHLPEYAYVYIAPFKARDSKGNKVQVPYVLEKGNPEFFLYPEK